MFGQTGRLMMRRAFARTVASQRSHCGSEPKPLTQRQAELAQIVIGQLGQ
ncbi:MAG TPA: hypothetical protein VFL55_22925 [Acetobacteraceae bacterium]|nr:hypothetical protein [Acetobacteraceae bacterium]